MAFFFVHNYRDDASIVSFFMSPTRYRILFHDDFGAIGFNDLIGTVGEKVV